MQMHISPLAGKNILVGVTGGIAAYKSAELIRRLRDHGAKVQVVMTPAAEAFIGPLTLQAVSGMAVRNSLLDPAAEAGMGHIELARWANLILIAPATADFLARAVHGMANDLLSTLCLAAKCPIALAPAMNQAMWHNPVTQSNMAKIATYPHFLLWGPSAGEQACGDVGLGRMLEPSELVSRALALLNPPTEANNAQPNLTGRKVVITAGPTREALDPVRYLSNQSSGKMGYALAAAAQAAGATVVLISGPTQLIAPKDVETIYCNSALEMHAASLAQGANADIFIGAAAVADYRPEVTATQKIKKGHQNTMTLKLVKNPDIIASVANLCPKPWVVGFAAETQNLEEYARQKLSTKKLDMVIANDVSDNRIGFNSDYNAVTVITAESTYTIATASKTHIAQQIIQRIAQTLPATKSDLTKP